MKSTVPFGKHARCYRPVCYRYAAAGHKGSQKSYRGPGTANSLFCGRERAGKYQNKNKNRKEEKMKKNNLKKIEGQKKKME